MKRCVISMSLVLGIAMPACSGGDDEPPPQDALLFR